MSIVWQLDCQNCDFYVIAVVVLAIAHTKSSTLALILAARRTTNVDFAITQLSVFNKSLFEH